MILVSPLACSHDGNAPAETLGPIQTTTSTVRSSSSIPRFYEVKSGDTLTRIAEMHGLSIVAIMEHNAIADPDDIRVGQVLELPLPDSAPTSSSGLTPPTTLT